MPLVFQVGLFCTVLVLGGVRFLRSLREARRLSSAPTAAAGPPLPGSDAARDAPRPPARPHTGDGQVPRAAGAPRRGVGRERWLHLAILWGVILFCVPFLAALALPSHAARLSAAIDSGLGGGPPVPETPPAFAADRAADGPATPGDAVPPDERLATARRARRGEMRSGLVMVIACSCAAAAAGLAAGVARKLRRPGLMIAGTLAGLAACGAGTIVAGPAASRLSGALQARRAVEEYASSAVIPAAGAALVGGPVRLVGEPEAFVPAEPYLYFRRPGRGDDPAGRVRAPFRLGGVRVEDAGPALLRAVRPRARLGPEGRELFIRADEEVLVMGFVRDGRLVPDAAYPAVVAPGGARRLLEEISSDLLGTAPARGRWAALLHVLFGAGMAWSVTVLLASATEYVLVRRRKGRRWQLPASSTVARHA